MNRTLLLVLVLGLLAPAVADAKDERTDLLKRFERYRAHEHELGMMALELRRAQQRLVVARGTLVAFRRGKSRHELEAHSERIDELEAEFLAAKQAYEQVIGGDAAKRYQTLKERVERSFGGIALQLRRLLSERKDDPALRLVRAQLLVTKGRLGLARKDLAFILKAQPENTRALMLMGRCLEGEGRTSEAVERYRLAVKLEATDEHRIRLAVALYWTNQFAEARALRDEVKAIDRLPAQLQLDHEWYLSSPGLERQQKAWERETKLREAATAKDDLPRVELVTSRGKIVLELYEDQAPNTVAHFVELVEQGFYDGLTWHRVQPLRLALSGKPSTRAGYQGTDPDGPGYRIRPELGPNRRMHFRGSVGLLARGGTSLASSQFYVMLRPDTELDRHCTVFGRVLSGLDVAARLEKGDLLEQAKVLRKRDHVYEAKKVR